MSDADTTDTEQSEYDQPMPDPEADPEDIEAALEEEGIEVGGDKEGDGMSFMDFVGGGGLKDVLLRETFTDPDSGHSYSQAHLVADIINVMRMDAKQMARLHGINVEVNKMPPERAAELLAEVAQNDGVGIIEVFQTIEEKRDHVFQQELTDEQYEQFMQFKEGMLYTVPGGDAE